MLILDSQVIGFRNSLSEDALYLSFEKLAFWTTGIHSYAKTIIIFKETNWIFEKLFIGWFDCFAKENGEEMEETWFRPAS